MLGARYNGGAAILAATIFMVAFPCFADDAMPPTVTLYLWMAPWEAERAADLVRDFEQLHDGRDGQTAIKVVMGQSAEVDIGGDTQRLLCAVAGGDPPDVVWFARHSVAEWASRGAFLPLQPFIDRDQRERPDDPDTLRKEQFFLPCWEEASWKGQLYAMPTDTDNRALYYNLDLFEKYASELVAAGCIDPEDPSKPGPPRTWTQLRRAAEILTEYDAQGRLVRVGFIPNFGNSWLYLYGWLNGGEYLSPDGKTCTLNAPAITEALVYMTEMYDAMGGAQKVYAFQSSMQQGDIDPFLGGKVAMKIDGNWFMPMMAQLRRDFRFRVAPAPAPEGKPQFGWCGGWSYVIPKGTKHPEEAWELIRYMVSKRAFGITVAKLRQQAGARSIPYIPNLNARSDLMMELLETSFYPDPSVEPKFKDAMRVFVSILPQSRYRPVTPAGQLLWNEQVRAMEAGIYRRFDTQDVRRNAQMALDRSTAVVQAELDRTYKPRPRPVLSWMYLIGGYVLLLAGCVAFVFHRFGRDTKAKGYFRNEHYAGYLFVLPWFLGFLLLGGGPILFSLFMSFCDYDVLHPPKWVGLSNYVNMLTNPLFYKSMYNTLFMALGIPLGMAVGLGIAMLLNHEIKGMAVYRTFFYLPAIMPAVAASILWIWIFNPQQGILNNLLAQFGIAGPAWLQDEHWSKPGLIIMNLWGAGGSMIVWLAGLKGIPRHLYEAAEIDGAGRLRSFWNITVPMLSPYIFFNLIMGLIGTFQVFTQAYVMTQGGPIDSTLFFAFYLFNNAFRFFRMGYASALAWVLFAIVLGLTVIQMRLAPRWVHYETDD